MRIAYHLATPPAPKPELDAAVQEVEALRREFGGELTHLYPGRIYRPWIRRRRLRQAQIERWLTLDREVDVHHVISDRALDYPILEELRRPVVLRLLTPPDDLPGLARIGRYGPIVVSSDGEAQRLRDGGVVAVQAIPPGIELDRFAAVPAPPEGPFTVLCASAPWTRRQFGTKGIDALLAALRARGAMRLILLWRGALLPQIERRLGRLGLASRTELITQTIRPEEVLARVHAAALVPSSPRVVKAFPHSLLEALAAGRPVITGRALALADWIEPRACGLVVHPTAEAIGAGLDRMAESYTDFRRAAEGLDMSPFSMTGYLEAHRGLYQRVLERGFPMA